MTTFIHGGDLYGCNAHTLDFSSNANLLGLPEGVKTALADSIDRWERYPDPLCRDLIAAIAQAEQVDPAYIHCGNGAADLIFRIAQAKKPRHALILAPTFAEYERALTSVGCEVGIHLLHEKDGFNLTDAILGKLSPALDMVVLCSPNNPTGHSIDRDLLQRIARKCADCRITMLLDESFNPFLDEPSEHSMKDLLTLYPHIILLKAFTKIYAMAGLRLGYLLSADPKLNAAITDCSQPWSVSMPAQIAGVAALADTDYLVKTRQILTGERSYLSDGLRKLGATVYGAQANYIFFKCHNCRNLGERLLTHDILIRSCANYNGLDDRFYRIAVKKHEANEKLIHAMKEILSKEG